MTLSPRRWSLVKRQYEAGLPATGAPHSGPVSLSRGLFTGYSADAGFGAMMELMAVMMLEDNRPRRCAHAHSISCAAHAPHTQFSCTAGGYGAQRTLDLNYDPGNIVVLLHLFSAPAHTQIHSSYSQND
uniref:Beta-lactamase-related domain-containing protein n=1 Tax=Knipowitschia caucasica TaxID=637954 RepID=A0AAV2K7Q9_KNICA